MCFQLRLKDLLSGIILHQSFKFNSMYKNVQPPPTRKLKKMQWDSQSNDSKVDNNQV